VLTRVQLDDRLGPGARRRLGGPLTAPRTIGPAAEAPGVEATGLGLGRHLGVAEGVAHLLDLLARDASAVEFERPVVDARSVGLPAADIDALERAKQVALGVRDQLQAHRRREAELAALFQTASDLAALTSVDDVLAAIVRRARALLGRDIAYLCLNDDERGDTYMRVTDGSVSAEFQAVRLPLGGGLGGLVAQQGVPIASADYFNDHRFRHLGNIDSAVHSEGLVSILGVPLKRGAQVIGVLFAADRRRRAFSRDEVALLSSLAAHAAVALDNARLLAETRSALISLEQANDSLREQSKDVELAVVAHDRLAELVLRGGGVAEVAAELAEVLGGSVELQGPSEMSTPLEPGQSAVPVATGSELLGRLVLTREGQARPADMRVLERGAVVTALLLLFNRHLAEMANRGRRDLLEDLLNGSVTESGEIGARAAHLDADLTGDLVVVVCAVPRHRVDSEQAAAFYAGRLRGLSARLDGHLVLLVPGTDPGAAAREAAAGLSRVLGGPVTAAGEQVVNGPSRGDSLRRAHRSARQGLAAMLALGREGQGATTADLGFIGVLLSAGDSGRQFVTDTLGAVLDYDAARGSDLAATLDAWFGEGGHLGRTASTLHVHPNTVGQRLSRVATLLGEDWSSPDRALQIQLALQLRKLLPA
jgi:DNA-binding PucR family transcriptional regulator